MVKAIILDLFCVRIRLVSIDDGVAAPAVMIAVQPEAMDFGLASF